MNIHNLGDPNIGASVPNRKINAAEINRRLGEIERTGIHVFQLLEKELENIRNSMSTALHQLESSLAPPIASNSIESSSKESALTQQSENCANSSPNINLSTALNYDLTGVSVQTLSSADQQYKQYNDLWKKQGNGLSSETTIGNKFDTAYNGRNFSLLGAEPVSNKGINSSTIGPSAVSVGSGQNESCYLPNFVSSNDVIQGLSTHNNEKREETYSIRPGLSPQIESNLKPNVSAVSKPQLEKQSTVEESSWSNSVVDSGSSSWKCTVEFKRYRARFDSSVYIKSGEYVLVFVDRGEDIGRLTNIWAATQPDPPNAPADPSKGELIRQATPQEVAQLTGTLRSLESRAIDIAQAIAKKKEMPMTIVDAVYRFDRKKLTFYYKSDHRLDFRGLLKDLYKSFRARIWLEQDE